MTENASHVQIADALVLPYLNHAARMHEEGYASREDIDNGMRFGCGLPAGPIAVIDSKGVDAVISALETQFAATGDPLHEPRPILRDLANADAAGEETAETVALRPISSVGVVGTGTMASGIVEVFAKSGYDVVFVGRGDDKVAAVIATITKNLAKAVDRGKATQEDADATLARISGATTREALADVDIVVEAIAEDLAIKQELFRDLDRITKPGTILATTTSSMPITDLAAETKRPQDVVGMHFFNPATIMKLVEIVRTTGDDGTAADVLATVKDLCDKTGKVAVNCSDRSGFIVNALLFPYLNDAVKLVDSGKATVEEVDEAITSTYGYPMGPFALLDVVGLDVSLAIQRELVEEFGHEGWTPAQTLVQLVEKGDLGRKTGKGFLTYA
ncbi:3-hydroxyacyl-CoA dehydrogenase [Knoellia sinensis KCTC 19936]|uniref:3-hydroxyacyl-CoA dehydrogenase n=1 Tax=Knoellia sinensis KCTC 19936 TaxID=1385520 RepID=A0A0A0JFM4_9MICO|nr:3-hydroxyacyl-CoA dehydrogenase NAD-binding domain-containing protein [Knoellia sinensis]KGN34877.1 3-hydroxyacyl-CoA dehydrogenase [Knoellia sinensis KCTC 19936]